MIEVKRLTTDASEQCTAYFSNGEEMDFTREELCAFHIRQDKIYTEEEFCALIEKIQCQRAKDQVMSYVLFCRRTTRQVYDKITGLGFPGEIAEALVEELTEKDYLDDREFCRSYIRRAVEGKSYSCSRIRLELKQKGICESLIEEILEEFSVDDVESARKMLNKKLRSAGERDYNKLYGFLLRKGFSGETVRTVLQEIDFE